jgi:hypothetical protein
MKNARGEGMKVYARPERDSEYLNLFSTHLGDEKEKFYGADLSDKIVSNDPTATDDVIISTAVGTLGGAGGGGPAISTLLDALAGP